MDAPKLKLKEIQVPTDLQSPAGMQTVYGSGQDHYAATFIPDIVYANYGERELRINLLKPANRRGVLPLIVFIQGSAWLPQERFAAVPQLADFAHQGYVVASVEYRHSLEAKFPAQIEDVKAAIRYLRAHANQYQIDPERVAVWGDSSGGHLAVLTGVTAGGKAFTAGAYADQSDAVSAVVDFYGPTDILQMNKYPSKMDHDAADSPESMLIGGPIQENKEVAANTNPIQYMDKDKKLPPFLIMHGDQDELVPFHQSVLLYEALRDAGQDASFYKVKGAGHGSRFWTTEVLQIVRSFLAAYV